MDKPAAWVNVYSLLLNMAIYSEFSHEKWWFSIVMLVYQRVGCLGCNPWLMMLQTLPSLFSAVRRQSFGMCRQVSEWQTRRWMENGHPPYPPFFFLQKVMAMSWQPIDSPRFQWFSENFLLGDCFWGMAMAHGSSSDRSWQLCSWVWWRHWTNWGCAFADIVWTPTLLFVFLQFVHARTTLLRTKFQQMLPFPSIKRYKKP